MFKVSFPDGSWMHVKAASIGAAFDWCMTEFGAEFVGVEQVESKDVVETRVYETVLEATADHMFAGQLDYVQVGDDMLYSYMRNGSFEVWSVDPMDSCSMEDAIQLFLVKSYKMGV